MKKRVTGILAILALWSAIAESHADEGGQKTQLDYITSTNYPVAGGKIRFDWKVKSMNGQGLGSDSLTNYTIQANLEEAGMYGFTNVWPLVGETSWVYKNGDASSFDTSNGSYTITPGFDRVFTAFIDQANFAGTMTVDSWCYSERGATDKYPIQVPFIPFPDKIFLSPSESNLYWFSQTNDLGKQFIVEQTDTLTNSTWVAVTTNLHSTTNVEYEASVPMTNSVGFFRVREVD